MVIKARIYQPAKTATQSGAAKTHHWVLEYTPSAAQKREPVMGWVSSKDTRRQVTLHFSSDKEAIDYAQAHQLAYEVIPPHARKISIRPYSDNFKKKV